MSGRKFKIHTLKLLERWHFGTVVVGFYIGISLGYGSEIFFELLANVSINHGMIMNFDRSRETEKLCDF